MVYKTINMNGDEVKASLKESLAAGKSTKLNGHTFQEIAVASILAYILEDRPLNNVSSESYWARTEVSDCEEYASKETHQEKHLKMLRMAWG